MTGGPGPEDGGKGFPPAGASPAHLFLVGVGGVGSAFLRQLDPVQDGALARSGVDLRLVGLFRSASGLHRLQGIRPDGAGERLVQEGKGGLDPITTILDDPAPRRILVDCTADPNIAEAYPRLLDDGVRVVAANKLAFSGSQEQWRRSRWGRRGRAYLEATVGAGLPVLRTAEDLVETGDQVRSVEAVLSGTLAFLCSEIMAGRPLSRAVEEARARGYTEPDPREDLSGQDVARKMLIVARELGLHVEPADVALEGFLASSLTGPSPGDGAPIADHDGGFRALRERALARGARLAYTGSLREGRIRVGLELVEPDHPFHGLRGSENTVLFRTERYGEPLAIRGPGAGPAVTAAGVLGDVLRAVRERGAWG
jgi:bifunctional aspartokinase / homoserine dehydrogenase 1